VRGGSRACGQRDGVFDSKHALTPHIPLPLLTHTLLHSPSRSPAEIASVAGKLDKRIKTNAEAIAELATLVDEAGNDAKNGLRECEGTARDLAALRSAVASGEAVTASISTNLKSNETELRTALSRLGSNESSLKEVNHRASPPSIPPLFHSFRFSH
jgi:hypothetical protein